MGLLYTKSTIKLAMMMNLILKGDLLKLKMKKARKRLTRGRALMKKRELLKTRLTVRPSSRPGVFNTQIMLRENCGN